MQSFVNRDNFTDKGENYLKLWFFWQTRNWVVWGWCVRVWRVGGDENVRYVRAYIYRIYDCTILWKLTYNSRTRLRWIVCLCVWLCVRVVVYAFAWQDHNRRFEFQVLSQYYTKYKLKPNSPHTLLPLYVPDTHWSVCNHSKQYKTFDLFRTQE